MLNELAEDIYQRNIAAGWHTGVPNLAVYLMNLHSEVSELWEAWRAPTGITALCDKAEKMRTHGIEPLTCIEEEIADIMIRTIDTAHAFDVDIDRAVRLKMAYNATREHRHGGKRA